MIDVNTTFMVKHQSLELETELKLMESLKNWKENVNTNTVPYTHLSLVHQQNTST